MSGRDTILVTGATGNTGRPLVRLLREHGARVRAASRSATPVEGGDHVRFDWADPSTHADVLRDVRRIYLVAPVGVADPEPLVRPFLTAARGEGVERVVLLSSSAVREGDPLLGQIHRLVRTMFPEWTVLRPSWFMRNIVGDHPVAHGIRTEGRIITATGDGRVGFVDAADIAAVAARALLDDAPHNTEHLITGPEALSYREVAALVSELTGRAVEHVDLSTEDMAARFTALGYPAEFAAALAALDEGIRNGGEDRTTDTVERVTGRPPRSLRDFLSDHVEALAPTPSAV
ncbi:Uncharacterized conserved protein YbjT, contains NAD(P)-binding and DUF2867 domains [Streptoalloteichus tenebrarius]|uniref:Uncharacterized conserved protein YbjT, contains NAD(P)-binding and DUF2867 domains n=1 Tax=Streptoalloteichus tenebrarius (strain ATCC 17920 / DSM 40477 / JCM 4838 / CBS 697.72 / NBRC 16177 / NCIMB 11028 / NRRL B-12390 / A12253. 1 / ISP 5477) TaxID=1933 RepID=A0ABT1HWX5_STRSD|nr:NAD(P)H-binding protein [Streptoalloteichus tenebrarius]MCP2259999.1 Uncharacterized conserved protein YbjT, contains NAD(P)-binding and DUF2867 domains [Streptoalloteichus tenebrarius]BFF03888.1 NAD(P)H-binding protein [Streptoalloteichus tenebrarius]